ncbi:MAG: SDR family oxidoreductase [Actinomycetota bacterium]|nr:SDR family oxidoreductase [Actinomycetota bacterium]
MTYFVTGATGFIGRRLVAELVKNRRGPIYVLVRPGSEHKLDLYRYQWGNSTRVKAVSGELTKPGLGVDPEWVAEHAGQIRHFFHLAASYDMTASREQNDELNTGGTKNALVLADSLGAGCFHITSSIAVSGSFRGKFTEDMFEEGQSFPSDYHRTKYESEKIVRDTATMPWRVYRPAIVVGDSTTGEMDKIDGPYYFFSLLKRMRDYMPQWLPIFGAGMGNTNLVPVDYVAQAMDFLAHKPGQDGKVFHLVNPRPQSNLDVINVFAKAAKSPRMSISLDNRVTDLLPKRLFSAVLAKATSGGPGELIANQTLGRLGVPAEVIAHIGLPTVYDSKATQEALEGSGLSVPKLRTYASLLWAYWEQNLDPDIRSDKGMRSAINGKTVVITGATSGIGKATALRVAALGGTVILVARGADKLEETKSDIEAQGGIAFAYPCDLTDLDAIDKLAKKISREHETVDFVVNNAGRSIRRSLRLSYDRFHDFERTMQLNYFGAIRLIMGLTPKMAAGKGGHVVNISSIGAQTYPPRFAAYVASKAALDAWSRVVSSELIGDDISFTSIHMPLVKTPMIAPTKIYDAFPTISPAQAADLILKAMRHKPHEINTLIGTAGEVSHSIAPNTAFRVLHQAYKIFPDSAAARGEGAGESVSRQQKALASVLKGVHW